MICGVLLIILSITFVLCGGSVPEARMMYYDAEVEEETAEDEVSAEDDVTAGAESEEFPDIQFNPEEDVAGESGEVSRGKPADSLASLKRAAEKQDPVSSDYAQTIYDTIRGGKL